MTLTLHAEVDGPPDAPPLVLSSSLGTTGALWEPQLPLLSASLRVVRYDHTGHGGSQIPAGPYELADLGADVLALLDRLELDRVSWCGISLGGMLGMWLAAHAPDRIEKLVLCCTAAHMPPASMWRERAQAVLEAGSPEPIADGIIVRWLTPGYAAAHPEEVARLRAMMVATPAAGYAACCGAIERMDLRPALSGIRAPTLVISGLDDPSTPPGNQEAIAAAIPGARWETVSPAAHLASVEQPDVVGRLILEHVTAP